MSDLISRQAAIDAVRNYLLECQIEDGDYHADGIMYELDRLPSAQPVAKDINVPCTDTISRQAAIDTIANLPSVQGWIPVGERLPPSGEDVIVSLHDDSGDTSFDYTSVGWTTPKGEYWIVGGDINHYVCAWMPMPRAYKRCK